MITALCTNVTQHWVTLLDNSDNTRPNVPLQSCGINRGSCRWEQMWRVERRKDGTYGSVELERKYVGQMYGGDCYVILYTYTARGRENHIVYYWLVRFTRASTYAPVIIIIITVVTWNFGDPWETRKGRMDQILVSLCCPPQSGHIDIKNVANSQCYFKQMPKMSKTLFFFVTLFVPAASQELLLTPASSHGSSQRHSFNHW